MSDQERIAEIVGILGDVRARLMKAGGSLRAGTPTRRTIGEAATVLRRIIEANSLAETTEFRIKPHVRHEYIESALHLLDSIRDDETASQFDHEAAAILVQYIETLEGQLGITAPASVGSTGDK